MSNFSVESLIVIHQVVSDVFFQRQGFSKAPHAQASSKSPACKAAKQIGLSMP